MNLKTECCALQQIPMFHSVDPANLKLFAISSKRMTYAAGETIFRQGDPSDALYIILEGSVDVIREMPMARVRLAQIAEGNVFGETGVLCNRERTTTIEAAGPVTLLRIDRNTFNEVAGEIPQLSFAIAKELARRLEVLSEKLTSNPEVTEV